MQEKKLNKLWEEWRYLQKSKKTRVDEKRQQKFGENLHKLWDIGALDAIEQMQKKQTYVLR